MAFILAVLTVLTVASPASAQQDSDEQEDEVGLECTEALDETTVTGKLVDIKELDGSPWEDGFVLTNVSPDKFYVAIVGTVRGETAITVLGRGDLLMVDDRYEFVVSQYLLVSEADLALSTETSPTIAGLDGLELPESETDIEAEEPVDTALADIATLQGDHACLAVTSIRAMSPTGPIDIEIPPGIVERLQDSYPKLLAGFFVFAVVVFLFGREPRG